MNRLDQKFQDLKAEGRTAFMPYLAAGDPDLETTLELVHAFEKAGADIIELGIPFSDPVADGPTIQAASQRALDAGVTPDKVFELVKKIRVKSQIPICFMTYYNLVYHKGLAQFVKQMVAAGADGLIIPDLSLEESAELEAETAAQDIRLISFVAPTSSENRIKKIAKNAKGFIYLVSLTGVTGARTQLGDKVTDMIASIRPLTDCPLCVGFGVSTPEQAKAIGKKADGVIVGSAIINEMSKRLGQSDLVAKTASFVGEMVTALKS